MAVHAMNKMSGEGVGYALASLNDVRHVFATALPQRGATLHAQADDVLRAIETVNRVHGTHGSIVHQAVFVADASLIGECRKIMREFYGPDLPASSYIPQAPCGGRLLAIEALGISCKHGNAQIERISDQLVVARHDGITWAYIANATPSYNTVGAYEQSMGAFQQLQTLLAQAGMRLEQVLRAWHYQGGIVAEEGNVQRYKELNRARADFYHGTRFMQNLLPPNFQGPAYPASTGIGTTGRGFSISAIALQTQRPEIVAVPLENPRQTPAFTYPAIYSPSSPQFARGMAISCGNYATIFISGTASVTHSEVQHVGDVAGQTQETLNNITALISEENLSRHGLPGLGTTLEGLGLARVYIKRPEDYEQVRTICEERLGELPVVYVVADVCRPDWLVEIEGIALSHETGGMVERNGFEPLKA